MRNKRTNPTRKECEVKQHRRSRVHDLLFLIPLLFAPAAASAQSIQFLHHGATLDIIGTALGDRVQMGYQDGNLIFEFETSELHTGNRRMTFSAAAVRKLRFFGNAGDDFFTYFASASPRDTYRHFHPQMELFGGPGNDTLNGGSKSDLIVGGSGDDPLLQGFQGDDVIFGGAGKDSRLEGGDGNDILCGGPGGDGMEGQAGFDRLFTEGDDESKVVVGVGGGEVIPGGCLLNAKPLIGDWDGNGTSDLGWHSSDRAFFILPGAPNPGFVFGFPTDTAVVGDWDNDGRDQAGVFRGVLNWFGVFVPDLGPAGYGPDGVAEMSGQWFGLATDKPVIGDWNGDGFDDIGVYRNGEFFLDNGDGIFSGTAGKPEFPGIPFGGLPSDIPVAGDWNGDNKDDVGVFRPATGRWHLDENNHGFEWNPGLRLEWTGIQFGITGDIPIVGEWTGDNASDVGVVRGNSLILDIGDRGWFGALTENPGVMLLD